MKLFLCVVGGVVAALLLAGCTHSVPPFTPPLLSDSQTNTTPFVPVHLESENQATTTQAGEAALRERFPCHPRFEKDFVSILDREAICPAVGILDFRQGTVTAWIRFDENTTGRRDHAILHTNDSRIVFYLHTEEVGVPPAPRFFLVARAVGNLRSRSGFENEGGLSFPEARFPIRFIAPNQSASLSSSSQEMYLTPNRWYGVAMKWQGFPRGSVRLFLNGMEVASAAYDQLNQNTLPWFQMFSVGFRPGEWEGEIRSQNGAQVSEPAPKTAMSLADGGIAIRDLRIYGRVLTNAEIIAFRNEI